MPWSSETPWSESSFDTSRPTEAARSGETPWHKETPQPYGNPSATETPQWAETSPEPARWAESPPEPARWAESPPEPARWAESPPVTPQWAETPWSAEASRWARQRPADRSWSTPWSPPAGRATSVDAWATLARALHSTSGEAPPALGQASPLVLEGETPVDRAKATLRAQAARLGTDEAAVRAALRSLTPPQMAELAGDPAMIDILLSELSGADLADAAAQLARGRIGAMSRADLAVIAGAPIRYGVGAVAGALGRDVLLAHREAVQARGTGLLHGTKVATPVPAGAAGSNCTLYVMDVLKRAFAARGLASTWSDVAATATTASGTGGLKGTELIKALQVKQKWEALFWSPDPKNPGDGLGEHPVAYQKAQSQGTYYGIAVDPKRSVINYHRTSATAQADMTGIERLRRLQFGVLTAKGGFHMALIINGEVYEVHWACPATDPNTITSTPLESFGWNSGAIAAPPGDLAQAARIP